MKKIIRITALVMAVILMTFSFAACADTAKDGTARETKKYSVTYSADEIPAFVADKVMKGAMMYDVTTGEELGLVTDVLSEDSLSYASKDGKLVSASKIGYRSLMVTATVEAAEDLGGWYIGDTLYGIGHKDVVRIGNTEVELILRSFEALDQ